MIRAAPGQHWSAFAFMFIATTVLYFNFAWFREQLCIVICPYGRIQSALVDDHSLVVGYDVKRGEPRGRLARGEPTTPETAPKTGDCIDCTRCVQVCPTGIDIRQGLQMECVGCTACIDACDDVMTKLHRPRGLIRYDSQKAFSQQRTRWIRPRTVVYFILLMVGASVATWALSTVKPANFGVTRMTGSPYILDDASVRNQFLVRIVNKRNSPATFSLKIDDAPAGLERIGFAAGVDIGPAGEPGQPAVV